MIVMNNELMATILYYCTDSGGGFGGFQNGGNQSGPRRF